MTTTSRDPSAASDPASGTTTRREPLRHAAEPRPDEPLPDDSRPDDPRIVAIIGHHVGFATDPVIGNARTFIRQRDFLLIEIVSDTGRRGWGEVFASPHAAGALIRSRFGRMVLGRSPFERRAIFEALHATIGYDRRGPAMMALSAIDMALHDLAARELGTSVASLLGGRVRDAVFAYASAPFIAEGDRPYAHYEREAERCLARGFRALKPRAGVDPRADGLMATALRRRIGDDVGLMVDINQGYTARAAIESANRMAEAGLLWIEEPVLPEDFAGYATIAQAVPTAIAGGEALGSLAAFRDALTAGALAVVQPDLSVCGGYTGFLQVAALASAWDLPVMPHVFGTIVGQRAALQAASLLPARRGGGPAPYPYLEIDATANPLIAIGGPLAVGSDGTVAVDAGPGTGLDLDGDSLAPWRDDGWRLPA